VDSKNQGKVEVRKVLNVGDSVSITIPSGFAEMLGVRQGDYVTVTIDNSCIVIKKLKIGGDKKDGVKK